MPESLANLSQGLDAELLRSSCRVGTRSGEAAGAGELRGLGPNASGGGLLLLLRVQPLIFNQENLAGGCSCPGGDLVVTSSPGCCW